MITRGDTKAIVTEIVQSAVRSHAGQDVERLSAHIKAVLEEQLRDALPQTIVAKVVEEDEDMKIVRHIHEEPQDTIQVEVTATLATSLKYLVLHIDSGSCDERLEIQFVDGSRDASSSDP